MPASHRLSPSLLIIWFALAGTGWLLPQAALAAEASLLAVTEASSAKQSSAKQGSAKQRSAKQRSAKQAAQVQAVVQAQLKAFAADDAALAFSYATPRIRKMFGNADTFLAMVRSSYPMVYRPASTSFFQPEKLDGAWVQRVQMSDAQGALWQATYSLELQRNGSWRINGCEVAASNARVA